MAKISLKDLTPIKSIPPQEIEINGKKVLVEQYLPLEKKAAMIERILANSVDETGFISPVRLAVFFRLEVVRCYSNISIIRILSRYVFYFFHSIYIYFCQK